MEHNRHEDVALRREGQNALTISGQQAYHKRPIALVSYQRLYAKVSVLTCLDPHERQNT